MAFFQLILKARKLEKARLRYEDEKLRSIEISEGVKPRFTLKQRLRRKRLKYRKKVKHFWSRIISPLKYTWVYRKVKLLRTDGTLENYIWKSIFGFLGGIFLIYMFFVFFVIQLNFTLSSVTMLCSVLGMILTLGLAFSYRVRCIVFLLLPQFFSKRGRQALMAYAFILTLTGPGKNTLHNTSVLSESLVCGQEQLKQAVKSVIDLIKEPFYALRDAISKVIKTVKVVVKKIKRTLVAIKRLVLSILRVITSVFQWLGSIVNICNKKLGTPFDRCQRVFDGAVADCKAKLGPLFGGICNLTYIVGALCYIVKPLDFICMLVSYVADTIVDAVRKKIKRFTRHIKAMFYVKVKFSHSFHFETNQSKTIEDVSTGIISEVRSRTDKFLAFFDWMSFIATFFIFFMLLRIMYYRHKWLTNDRFDNKYLTDDLRTIDLIRTRQEKETILPLNRRERNQYIPLTSITLIKVEKVKLAKSAVFLCLTTFKICIHMMADYSLYWILSTIRFHGRFETKVQRPNSVGVYVSGNGYLADLYRSIVRAFTPHAKDAEIDITPCLPNPIPPDLDRYTQIMMLIGFCWIMAIFEPYGLRLRHVVMCKYHPERAKQRAAWLYNHIMRSRGSFLKFARRQLRRKFGMIEGDRIERITFRERCLAICPFLNKLFPRKQNMCLLCGAVERSDQEPHIKCATPDCVGLFCIQCYADLQNLCTICRSPIEYGDLSDISEERDSSDDQLIAKKEPVPIGIDICKEEEPIIEEKPEEEKIQEEGIPEEKLLEKEIPEERILEEKLLEKEIPEERILEEKLLEKEIPEERIPEEKMPEEKIDEIIVEKKDKSVQTDDDIDESSSESIYSYTYQERSSREIEIERRKTPFKDVEAQKIREDVTIQIFNDPLAKEITSSSEDPTSCFVVRARRRLRTRLKRKSCSSPRKDDSSTSTSIANTESWPTEELDEEEVVHIEMDDGSKELLLKDVAKEKKRSRVRRILATLTKIPWLGKGTKSDSDSDWRTRKPSLVNRIARKLFGTQSVSSVRTNIYRRIRTTKKEAKRKESSSASSSTSDEENEESTFLKTHDRQVDCLQIISDHDDSEDNIYNRNYDSHRARRRTICRQPNSHIRADDVKLKYPHEKKFTTKKLPRYLQPISKDTIYFEVDEIKDSQLKRRCVHPRERINVLSDTRTSFDSQKTNKQNVFNDYTRISCACTSQKFCDIKQNYEICQSDMNTTTEHNTEISETNGMSETDKKLLIIDWQKSGQRIKTREIVTTEGTSTDAEIDIETDRQKIPEKVVIRDDRRKSLAKNGEAIIELNDIAEEKDVKKYSVKKERAKNQEARKDVKASRVNEKAQLYDPLASLQLYGITYQEKRREKFVEKKLTKQPESAEETCIGDTEMAKSTQFEEDTEMWQKDTQDIAREIRRSTEMPEKSIQTNLRKFKRYKKSAKIPHTDANIFKACSKGKKEKRKNERREKWIDKREDYKASESDSSSPRGERKSCDKATLIKEKRCNRRRERKKTCDRDVQTQRHSRRFDDVQRHEKVASTFRPAIELSENRQTRSNIRNVEDVQGRQDGASVSKFTNEPEVCSCNVQPQFKAPDQIIHCQDHNYWNQWKLPSPCNMHVTHKPYRYYRQPKNIHATKVSRHVPNYADVCSSELVKISSQEKSLQMKKTRYDVDVRETRLEIPMLKKYLPPYQAPGLIEELKKHDRMRLIKEREARRWTTLNALRSTKDSSLNAKSKDSVSCDTSITCDAPESLSRLTSVSTKLTEDNNLPYQETQIFKDVMCEFRKVIKNERPLISLFQRADKPKDLKQLFPPTNEDRREIMPTCDKAVSTFKKHEEECSTIHKAKQEFQSESFNEMSSICNYYGKHRSGVSTSADETTDNNNDIT
ncbi:uncharacterized protein [Anoplolepis gracilipes]|uniref:uncharacterized protein n=1 Tax=Anoplolepis gracilipes TaxID=354296 RepID=UPI003B9E9C6D